MKKYRFILPALLAVGILTTTFATETVPRITADGNAPSGILRCGETAELTIALSPLPEEAKYLKCEQFVNGKKVSEQFIPASEKFQVKKSLTDPGWFALLGTACDAERKPLPNPRPAHAWDKVLKGGIGVLFSPEKIPHRPAPADFEEFWRRQRAEVDKVPLRVKRRETSVPDRFKDRGRCYEIEIDCTGGVPVRGYLSIPHHAEPGSLPVVVLPHGAGVYSAAKPVWRRNVIAFEFNAHGIENGRESAYYQQLMRGALRSYHKIGAGNPESWYFKGMFQRLMRALDYVKTLPEWDRKNLIVQANSMGGGQALAAAALDKDVSLCLAAIPAFGDLRGPVPTYPRNDGGAYVDYFDTANFARLIRCPVYLSAGLIDFTCPPYNIATIYNALPESSRKGFKLYPTQGHIRYCVTDGEKVYQQLTSPKSGAGKSAAAARKVQSHAFRFGEWEFAVNDRGEWEKLRYRRIDLIPWKVDMLRLQLGKRRWSKMNVRTVSFDEKTGVLRIDGERNGFEISHFIRFDARKIPGLLEQEATLRLVNPSTAGKPVPFYSTSFCFPVAKKALLHAPGALAGDTGSLHALEDDPAMRQKVRTTPRRGETLSGQERFTTAAYTMPLQAELPGERGSLLFLIDDRRETARQWINVQNGNLVLQQYFESCGWAYPGVTHTIGSAGIHVSGKDAGETLRSGIVHDWYRTGNLRAPQDRPDWVADAVMFEFIPRRLASENGFRTITREFLPRMQRLGFNTLWSQPANTGPTYMPVDYQKLCADFGTPEEYAAMCNEAAKRGIRLLQDIVPHGGTVESARERGNSVFALRFLENGGVLPPGRVNALAFNSKEWQQYVADSARMFTRLGAAGFRIDQCGGSGPDWRRTDWPPRDPDTPPAGTDLEWWKKSLPMDRLSPPPFRASLSTRQGGYELIQAVRGAAREVRKDAAVLAEVPDAVHVRSGDFIYDFMGRVWLHKFLNLPVAEFVPAFTRRLEEQYFTDPADLIRMRYVELHDGPSSVAAVGLGPARALTALLYFAHGIPLAGDTTGSFDLGNGPFLARLNRLRAENAPLRRGVPDYRAIRTGDPAVFAVLRKTDAEQAVGLINFTNSPRTIRAAFPENVRFDAETGEPVGETLRLEPWQARLFTSREVAKRKAEKPAAAPIPTESAPRLRENADNWQVDSAAYTLRVNRKSGLIDAFAPAGKESLCRSALLLPIRPEKCVNRARTERDGETIRLTNELTFPGFPGRTLSLTYHCSAGGIRLEAAARNFGEKELALLFAAPGIDRYQVDTADGRLDDWFEARPPETKQDNRLLNDLGYEHFRYYLSSRLARNILYSSNRVPLNWQSPEIRAFRGNDGVVWRQENPLTEPSAGLFLYSQFPGRKEWHLAAFLSQNLPLTTGVPARFTLTLKPIRPDQVPAEKAATIRTGALTVAKDDASLTCVTHPDYAFTLARHGGGIARLRNAKGETLLRDWEIESQGGYSRRISTGGDFFDGVMIFQDEKFLRIRCAAFPRNPGRGVLLTGLASLVEYAFPLEGGGPFFGSYRLMRRGSMPKKGGRIVLRGELPGTGTDAAPFRILSPNLPRELSGLEREKTTLRLPLLEEGKPFPAYRWNGITAMAFSAGTVPENLTAPEFLRSGLALPEPPERETFDDFTVAGTLLDAAGTMEHTLPWTTNPPPRITCYGAAFCAGDQNDDNPALRLRAYTSARLLLRVPQKPARFGFSLKQENRKPVRLECHLIYQENGRERSQLQLIDLPAADGKAGWREYRFDSPVPTGTGVAALRFQLLDVPGAVLIDEAGFFPENE